MNMISELSQSTQQTSSAMPKRAEHGEIICFSQPYDKPWRPATLNVPESVMRLAEEINELIGFAPGIRSLNRKGGFLANNFAIYGYDTSRNLIAMQYRQAWKRKETDWLNTRKAYILAGLDEGDQLFSHVLNTSFQRNPNLSESTPEEVVRWAEGKIFRVPMARLHTIIRQGDVALVPVRAIPRHAEIVNRSEFMLQKTHKVLIDGLVGIDRNSRRCWVDGLVQIDHVPEQHKSIDAEGRFEIVVGERGHVKFMDANTID